MKNSLKIWVEKHELDVTPSREEVVKVHNVAKKMVKRCEDAIKETSAKARVILGGSYAHGTWLPGKGDVDIFLALDKSIGKEGLPKIGLKIASIALSGYDVIMRYAEHPYLESFVDGIRVNIVPCLESKPGEWVSAADRSPHHTEYLVSRLNDDMKLHVRLLKKFLQAQGLYGAEIKVRGFSGYVCEVLIVKYGDIFRVVEEASRWKPSSVISVEPYNLKVEGFAILDPVDTRRNLARAISVEKLTEFIFLCRIVREGTKCDPFTSPLLQPASFEEIRPLLDKVVVLYFKHNERKEDTLWGELYKSSKKLVYHLEKDGFSVLNYSVSADNVHAAVAFLTPGEVKLNLLRRVGPEVYREKETFEFIDDKRNLGWFFSDEMRSRRIEARKLCSVEDALAEYMEKPVESVGFSKGLASEASKTWKLLKGREIERSKDEVIRQVVRNIFGYSRIFDQCG